MRTEKAKILRWLVKENANPATPTSNLEKSPRIRLDIDGFDPSIAPGTGTPSHGGFIYCEVLELIAGLAKRGKIVGVDLVEVAPDYDHAGSTAVLATQILLNTIGRVFAAGR